MSDSEQPTVSDQPVEQPASENQPAETEEQPTDTGEDTQPPAETDTPAAEPPSETSAEETPATDEGEAKPSGEETEGEAKPAEEGQPEEPTAAGEGEEVGQAEPEPEPKPEVEEPVEITPEGSPFWLPTEDVLAKGLPENEVENFKNFYFKQTHSLQAWYDKLKEYALQTEFITLSKEEIDALSVEGDLNEEQQQVISALEDRVNQAIELFEEDGAIVKVNGRNAKDAIMDRDEEAFVAQVRDAVVNELEVEKQRANAYAIWKEQERPPSAFKRGINSIRASFRRSRVQSTGKRETKPKLEEEKKNEEKKDEEAPKEEQPQEGGAAEGEEGGATEGEGASGPVTVEVQVEGGDDKPADEAPKDEGAAEAPKDEAEAGEAPKDEPEVTEAPKDEPEVTEAPKEEPKEDGDATGEEAPKSKDEETKGEDGEIEKVEEPEPKAKTPSPVRHKPRKAKTETLDNQILRAFVRSTAALDRVKSGKEAIELLRKSVTVRNDLNQLKAFGGVEGVQVSLSVCRWQESVAEYPGMEFRGFVYKNELNGLSQYNDTAYYPNTDTYYNTIQSKVEEFFKANIQETLRELENYIIDFYVTPEKVLVVRLNPFYTAIGACLFTWAENGRVLTQGPFEFRIVDTPRTAPEAFSSFQQFWQTMLDSVLQQRRPPQRKACILL